MSTNEITPLTQRNPDALVDCYREASARLGESPNPRVRSAVLANAALVAREANAPKHNEVLTKKRAANDGMWRYAAAASVMVAGVAAFIVNQWQSGEAELFVNESSVTTVSPANSDSPQGNSGAAQTAVGVSPKSSSPANSESATDTAGSEKPIAPIRDSEIVDTHTSAKSARQEKKSINGVQTPETPTANAPRVNRAGDVNIATEATRSAQGSIEISPPNTPTSTLGGSSDRATQSELTKSESTSSIGSVAKAPSTAAASPMPTPATSSAPAPATPGSTANAARGGASSESFAVTANPLPQRKSAAPVSSSMASPPPQSAPSGNAADAPTMTLSRERSATNAASSAQRVGEMNESMRRGVANVQANGVLRQAVREGDVIAVRNALRSGADANIIDGIDASGTPILTIAVQRNSIDIVIELLRAGADPTRRDGKGATARDYAEQSGNREMINVLRR